jgi:hypothetical protein
MKVKIDALRQINPSIISQVARNCADRQHNDFKPEDYQQEILTAMSDIAQKYSLLKRTFSFTNKIQIPLDQQQTESAYVVEAIKEEFKLPLTNIGSAYKLTVNEIQHDKAETHRLNYNGYEYYIYRNQDGFYMNYTPRDQDDEVILYYVLDINIDSFDDEELSIPILPNAHEKEAVRIATYRMGELGIAKFTTGDKLAKYGRILQTYRQNENIKDEKLVPNDGPIVMTPWRFP